MKKILFLILAFLILICSQSYAANRYGCTALTGGGTGALDALDITASGAPNSDDLADGDSAIVTVISSTTVTVYEYIFDADGTDAESSPDVIRPDDYSSGGVWRLVKFNIGMIPDGSGSGLDADTLDGHEGDYYAAHQENELITGNWMFSGTNLDVGSPSGDSPQLRFQATTNIAYFYLSASTGNMYFESDDTDVTSLLIRNTDASTDIDLDVDGNINIGSGKQYKIGGSQISSSDLSDGSSLLKSSDIGTSVQAWDAYLDDIAGITASQGDILYFNGTDWINLAPGTSGQFLQTQGLGANPQWATPSGSGDVTGPSSSTDNAIARFDGTGGKTIQNSNVTIDDTGNLNIPSGAVYQINGTQISTQNLSDGSTLGSATNIGITSGDNYTNFGSATDNSINELFAAIDASWPSGSGAPTDAEYVTLATNATLSAERVLTEGTALDITDGGAGGNVTIAFDPTEITDTTWGVNTDTSQVWTWDTGTGTDPSLTITDDDFTFNKVVKVTGFETTSADGSHYIDISNTNGFTTGSPSEGWLNYDESENRFEFYDGSDWGQYLIDSNMTGVITSTLIADGAIVNADISDSAAIGATKMATVMKVDGPTVNLGNGSDAITTGTRWTHAFKIPFKHDLDNITLTTNETSGSITIDVWKDTLGDTNGLANITVTDSLFNTASKPEITDASSDNTVIIDTFDSGEATDVAADTWYVINVDSASTLTFVAISFEFTRKD